MAALKALRHPKAGGSSITGLKSQLARCRVHHEESVSANFSVVLDGAGVVCGARHSGYGGFPAARFVVGAVALDDVERSGQCVRRRRTAKGREYLDGVCSHAARPRLSFQRTGEEVSHRGAPMGRAHVEQRLSVSPGWIHHSSSEGAQGITRFFRWTASLHFGYGTSSRAAVFLGPRGLPIPGVIIGVITLWTGVLFPGLVFDQADRALRAATRQLAAGDLTARSGAPASKRRDEVAGWCVISMPWRSGWKCW